MFNLEPVAQYRLGNPPLAQALAQVRFPIMARLQSLEGVANLQDALYMDFPYMDRVSETTVAVGGPSGLDLQPEQSVSWHFTDDEGHLLVVGSNVATLSIGGRYAGIADFTGRFVRVLTNIRDALNPRRCDRIGVRFLNIVPELLDTGEMWKDWFNQNVVGWSSSEIVRGDTRLQASVSQIQLVSPPVDQLAACPAEVQAVVRHGVVGENSVVPGFPPINLQSRSFFLDMDLFVVAQQPFETNNIAEQFVAMHSQVDRFFRWTLTEAGEKHFGLEERR